MSDELIVEPSNLLEPGLERRALSPGREALRRLVRKPVALACLVYILIVAAVAISAGAIAPYRYDFEDTNRYQSLPSPPDARHLLGTDELGEDVVSRLLYGARVSLGVALVTVAVEAVFGLPLGLVAGYYGGWTDTALMRVTDVVFAFPDLLLAILLRAMLVAGNQALPPVESLLSLFFALGIVGWPAMARLVRGQALSLRKKEFIEAARALGARDSAILWRHLLPNLTGPVIVQVTQDIAAVMLAEATLSFLGLGVQPPFPSWGHMIFEAIPDMQAHPLLIIAPSLVLAITVCAFNFLGDALRDAMDPRQR